MFIDKNFLAVEVCRELRAEAERSIATPAMVTKTASRVDVNMRQTSRLNFSEQTEELINGYFLQLTPRLENFFDVTLSGFERFQFLRYRAGDFYKRHSDRNDKPESPAYIKARRISVVLFLSTESQNNQPENFTGGTLLIWDGERQKPARIAAEMGKLVAFRSDFLHEVEPVHSGNRYSIVNWFYE